MIELEGHIIQQKVTTDFNEKKEKFSKSRGRPDHHTRNIEINKMTIV